MRELFTPLFVFLLFPLFAFNVYISSLSFAFVLTFFAYADRRRSRSSEILIRR